MEILSLMRLSSTLLFADVNAFLYAFLLKRKNTWMLKHQSVMCTT